MKLFWKLKYASLGAD